MTTTQRTQLSLRSGSLLAPCLDYFLVDGSGSMQDKWWQSLAAMDNFMSVLRAKGIQSHGIVQVFDSHNLDVTQRDSTISDWKTFDIEPLTSTWGGTPLYDAINVMVRRLADLDPPSCSIVIVTDGDDTGNQFTTHDQARNLLEWCRGKGWQVTFLGADFNNSRQAKLLGADESNSLGVQKALLAKAGTTLGEKRSKWQLHGDDINFSDEEKKDFGGYLAAPTR